MGSQLCDGGVFWVLNSCGLDGNRGGAGKAAVRQRVTSCMQLSKEGKAKPSLDKPRGHVVELL